MTPRHDRPLPSRHRLSGLLGLALVACSGATTTQPADAGEPTAAARCRALCPRAPAACAAGCVPSCNMIPASCGSSVAPLFDCIGAQPTIECAGSGNGFRTPDACARYVAPLLTCVANADGGAPADAPSAD